MRARALALALALLPAPAAADPCLRAIAGERLELLCLTGLAASRPLRFDEVVRFDHALAAQGYPERLGIVPEPPNPALMGFVAPTIAYSSNVNGGNPRGDLVLGDLVLRGDPALERRSGLLAGAVLGGAGRYRLGPGRYLDASLAAGYAHAPRLGVGVATVAGAVCLNAHLHAWWYLDACADARRTRRDLLDEREGNVAVTLTRLFSSGPATHHEAGLTLRRFFADDHDQGQVTAAWRTLARGGAHWSLALTLGEAVEDRLALRTAASGGVGTLIAGRPLHLWVRHEIHDGGRLLGVPRRDARTSLGVSVGLISGLALSASHTWIDSSIPFFNETETAVSLQLTPWTF